MQESSESSASAPHCDGLCLQEWQPMVSDEGFFVVAVLQLALPSAASGLVVAKSLLTLLFLL